MTTTLLVFTIAYPYSGAPEAAFLDPEVEHLLRAFDRVCLVPAMRNGKRGESAGGLEVLEGYAEAVAEDRSWAGRVVKTLASSQVWADVALAPWLLVSPSGFRALGEVVRASEKTRDWIVAFITREGLSPASTLLYTYWLGASSLGAGLAKGLLPGIRLASRAHGGDLYHERHRTRRIPRQADALQKVDRLFTVSEHGRAYVAKRYPWAAGRCEVARLGVRDPGVLSKPSEDGVLRLASCSFAVPVKRLRLLSEGVVEFARRNPGRHVEWFHMGGGPCLEDVRVALASAPGNLVVDLPGQVAHADVHASYRAKPCDAFLNVSASEGVPVSVMEALSYGIPVVATAVGGTAELLGHGGGKLLVPNPSAGEIASALFGLTTDGGRLALRRASRQVWADLCRADVNFSRFAGRLRSLLDSPGSALAVP